MYEQSSFATAKSKRTEWATTLQGGARANDKTWLKESREW